MLKKVWRLFLGLVVCTGSACVTPTHASSAQNIIITHIQASGELGAKDEYVALHNNSALEVDITNWCITNKSAVSFACFTPTVGTGPSEQFIVPGYGEVSVVSSDHASASGYPPEAYSRIYDVTNQVSGSIVNAGDTLSVINEQGEIVDMKSWESPIAPTKVLARLKLAIGPDIYATSNAITDWASVDRAAPPASSVIVRITINETPEDPATPGEPAEPPQEPSETPPSFYEPIITELLANPSGSDVGNEFIELYNPNEQSDILLDEYVLLIGIDPVKSYSFPPGAVLPAGGYSTFSNADINFTLVNTAGQVQLAHTQTVEGTVITIPIGDTVTYTSSKDDYSWGLINGTWQYTSLSTPGSKNVAVSVNDTMVSVTTATSGEHAVQKPCAPNQFRNPASGRCKLLSSASSAPTPCTVGQQRNPETHRCRNIAATSTEPTPCKPGQERNPETNRCRAIVKMSQAGFGVLGVQTNTKQTMSWYYWAAIGGVVLLVMTYAVWEWREELRAVWSRIRSAFAKHAR